MQHALYLPPFGELADPRLLMQIAERAEAAGWDGLFLWGHILRPESQPQEVADVWVALAAIATTTSRLRIGPMVTPTARRRPQIVAREAITLDWLSGGRVTLGLGLGVDTSGELSRFGEMTDAPPRGDALDEAARLIADLLAGDEVHHRGNYFVADGVRFLPRPVQLPRIPMWFAARGAAGRPVRRAARYDGLFVIELDIEGLRQVMEMVDLERGDHNGFDIAVIATKDTDLDAWERVGATWAMCSFRPGASLDEVLKRVEAGPS